MVLDVLPPEDHSDESGCTRGEPCGKGLEKIYPTTAVRYGTMRFIGEFKYPKGMTFGCGKKVVVQTKRGTEIGEQVSLTCSGCDKSVSREQILSFTARSGSSYYELGSGRILRPASDDDIVEFEHICKGDVDKRRSCQNLAKTHNLDMKVVTCEQLLGGERIIFYFMADGRIDFRNLVMELAKEFQTRIEMRQVGARDEARLVADFETCGRECCCKTFLKTLKPVSMKMAKLQKATLDPSKVSGRCGRLKCCLRYEHTRYEDLDKRLPRVGTRVRTAHGNGRVAARQILTQLLQIDIDGSGRIAVGIEDLLTGDAPPPAPPKPAAKPERSERGTTSSGSRKEIPSRGRRGDRRSRGGGKPANRQEADRGKKAATTPTTTNSSETTDSTQSTVPKKRRTKRRKRNRGRSQKGENGSQAEGGKETPPQQNPPKRSESGGTEAGEPK